MRAENLPSERFFSLYHIVMPFVYLILTERKNPSKYAPRMDTL